MLSDEDKLDELVRVDFDLEVEQYFADKKINRDTVVQREHVEDLETKLKVRIPHSNSHPPMCARALRTRVCVWSMLRCAFGRTLHFSTLSW